MWQYLTPFRIAVILGIGLSALRYSGCHSLELVDTRGLDYRFIWRGPRPPAPEVVIVAIDDASVEQLGRWPWSRPVMARLLDQITAAEPAVVGFDIVQSEKTAALDVDRLRERAAGIDAHSWEILRNAAAEGSGEDAALAAAVKRSGRTVLGYFFESPLIFGKPPAGVTDPKNVRISTYNLVQPSKSGIGETFVPLARVAVPNLPELTAVTREVGYFNFIPDDDGSYRRVPLVIRYKDEMALPLSLAMLRIYRPGVQLTVRFSDHGVESVRLGGQDIPIGDDGSMLINYRGPGRTFTHIPAADVLAGKVPAEAFRNRLVLVGVTAAAVYDIRVSPFDPILPGVEIHANLIENILRNHLLSQPKWAVWVEIGMTVLLVLLLGLGLHFLRGVYGALGAVVLTAAYLAWSQWMFVRMSLPLSLVYPLLGIGLTYISISVLHYVVEEREKRRIRDAFGLYLTPSVARLVSERPELLTLGGETRELTVLFTDIRGFTTISERFQENPHTLVALLNEFLGGMTDVIFTHDGTLDKYVGDEIMAVWGAPLAQADHAARACYASLEMMAKLATLNEAWIARGWPALDIGVGLNSGPMVVGNMGSERRLSYTVIGDNVNLGARLEGLNKLYGTHIIASEATVQAAGDLVTRELDIVRVKGKGQGVRIFEVLGRDAERARWASLIERFEAGVHAYRRREWEAAVAAFAAVLDAHPADGPARLYLGRVRGMMETPPAPDWDGVTVMEVK